MKNPCKTLLCLTLAAVLFCSPLMAVAYDTDALSGLPLQNLGGFTTAVVDKEGDTHQLAGVLDIAAFEQSPMKDLIAAYTIYNPEGTELLSVELCNIPTSKQTLLLGSTDGEAAANGYYKTEFPLSAEENTHAFLTGLSQSKIETIQAEILEKALTGEDFNIEDVDFIDSEKTSAPDDDDLCWAASAANMLHYTGWGKQASAAFTDEDVLFEHFIDSFEDGGGNQFFGLEWFFHGIYRGDTEKLKNTQNEGLLTEYDPSGLLSYILVKIDPLRVTEPIDVHAMAVDAITEAIDALRKGYGVGAGIEWGLGSGSGHALTVWGYLFDRDKHVTDPSHYLALLVSDPDSDKSGSDRSASPDVLHALSMTPYQDADYTTWRFANYSSGKGYLDDFTLLKPYDTSLLKENSTDATRSLADTPDLSGADIYISTTTDYNNSATLYFLTTENVCLTPSFCNSLPLIPFSGDVTLTLSITDQQGNIIAKHPPVSGSVNLSLDQSLGYTFSFGTLPAGSYTATATIETTASEAYRCNNSLSVDFQVIDAETPCIVGYNPVRGKVQTYLPEGLATDPKLLIVSYDANGALCDIKNLSGSSLATGKGSVDILSPQGSTNKALLWDYSTLKPLSGQLALE